VLTRKIVTASGSAILMTVGGTFSLSRNATIIAGIATADERELNASA
jgi:hypothetical protein